MEPKIITVEEKKVIGIVLKTFFTDERNKKEIPPFFHNVLEEKKLDKVPLYKPLNLNLITWCVINFILFNNF